MKNIIVAIDGPAGSGKGTVTKIVAEKLNLVYIDTGAMYRCVTLAMLNEGLNLSDTDKIARLSKKIKIDFDEAGKVYLNGEDVSLKIREKNVTSLVSQVSSIVLVRSEMVSLQRDLAKGKSVIMEGRDITTVVFPNADFKIYLDATVDVRAKRRFIQNQEKNIDMSYEEILENIKKRDYNDMHKEVGSLVRAEDALYIDSTNMSIDEVAQRIIDTIKGGRNETN